MRNANSKSSSISLAGLLIERKTDILAFAAFVISLSTAAFQFAQYVVGERLTALQPRDITIFENVCDNRKYIGVIVQRGFANLAAKDHGSLVLSNEVRLNINENYESVFTGSFNVNRKWNKFKTKAEVDCKSGDNFAALPRMTIQPVSTHSAFVVSGGQVISPEVLFTASGHKCRTSGKECPKEIPIITRDELLKYAKKNDTIEIKMRVVLRGRSIDNVCIIAFRKLIPHFERLGFINVPCDKYR